jgi:hypothetical protein
MKASHYVGISLAVGLAVACGKIAQQQEPKLEPASAQITSAEPKAEASPVESAAAPEGSAAQPAEEKAKTPGRPMPIYQNPSLATTIGADGAVMRFSSGLELRIPPGALKEGRNIRVAEDKRVKGSSGKLGTVYVIEISAPDAEVLPGAQKASTPYPSHGGDPFVLKLPLPAGTSSANLAVETTTKDAKAKTLTSTWAVVGMTKHESASPSDRAVFELSALPDGHVHLTGDAPSTPPAAK